MTIDPTLDGWTVLFASHSPDASAGGPLGLHDMLSRACAVVETGTEGMVTSWTTSDGSVTLDPDLRDGDASYDRLSYRPAPNRSGMEAFIMPSIRNDHDNRDNAALALRIMSKARLKAESGNDLEATMIAALIRSALPDGAGTLTLPTPWSRATQMNEKGSDVLDERRRLIIERHAPRTIVITTTSTKDIKGKPYPILSLSGISSSPDEPVNPIAMLRAAPRHAELLRLLAES